MTNKFLVQKRGSQLFINGVRILEPTGRTSVRQQQIRDAVKRVAGRK